VITISLTLRNLHMIAAVLAGDLLLQRLWNVVLLAAVGLLIAAALMPYVDWLWRRLHNRAAKAEAVSPVSPGDERVRARGVC
jgi:predicted PurR-regulated permease PerM